MTMMMLMMIDKDGMVMMIGMMMIGMMLMGLMMILMMMMMLMKNG
jgi:hypothetical protein